MPAITPPEIPDSQVAFAKAVAAIAESHGIDRFSMTFRPKFEDRLKQDSRISGDLKIQFSATDGRGRPCRGLSIRLETNLELVIESNPESFS